jgi:hypothetical protein
MTELRLGVSAPADDYAVLELAEWLGSDDELSGRVRLMAPPAPDGAMGAALPEIALLLGPAGGVAVAFASVLVTWLRRRSGPVSVRVTRGEGSEIQLVAENVRALTADEVRALVAFLAVQIVPEADSGRADRS